MDIHGLCARKNECLCVCEPEPEPNFTLAQVEAIVKADRERLIELFQYKANEYMTEPLADLCNEIRTTPIDISKKGGEGVKQFDSWYHIAPKGHWMVGMKYENTQYLWSITIFLFKLSFHLDYRKAGSQ